METARPNGSGGGETDAAIFAFFKNVLVPLWLVPGVLDWYWHRVTKIEQTAGARESIMHGLMLAQAGVPLLSALLLEANAGTIALSAAGALLHEATVMWDIAYTSPRRKIAPREQHTHAFMEAFPFFTAALVASMHPRQSLALLGLGDEKPRFALKLSRRVSQSYLVRLGAASLLFGALPYAEELVRCLRAHPTLGRLPVPEQPPSADSQRRAFETQSEGYES